MSETRLNETESLRERVIESLRTVNDPEIPVNIYDLGLIYRVDVDEASGGVDIDMTLTSPACPVAELIPGQVHKAVAGVEGVGRVKVGLVWEPKWTVERMSEDARLVLDMMDVDVPRHLSGGRAAELRIGGRRHRRE